MNKWIASISLISLLMIEGEASGWGGNGYVLPNLQTSPELPSIDFPLNADQAWFVKPSYLIWRPSQEDTDIGISAVNNGNNNIKRSVKEIDFGWSSGVRVGIGRYLPNHQQWDVTLFTTYYYNDSKSDAKGNLPSLNVGPAGFSAQNVKTIDIGWNSDLLGNSIHSEYGLRLNYFTWDLSVGRQFSLLKSVVFHPFIGLRAGLIYEKYSLKNESAFAGAGNSVFLADTQFKAKNNFWGIGPRIGTDFSFHFGAGWSFIGGLSGSLLYSRYNIHQNIDGVFPVIGTSTATPVDVKISDADTLLAVNLDAAIGLGWEKWVRNHSVRVAPSFLFEVVQWYGYNHWLATDFSRASALTGADFLMHSHRRKDGDLGFLGFSVNLQIDF